MRRKRGGRGEGVKRKGETRGRQRRAARQQRVKQVYHTETDVLGAAIQKKKKQWMGELKVKRGVGAGKRTEDRRRENTSMLCTC